MKVKTESEVAQLCLTLSDPMNCSLPGSSTHGIFQARVLEWGAIAFSVRVLEEMSISLPCNIISRTTYLEISFPTILNGEGNGTPLQHSCLENPMDGGAWWPAVHGIAEGPTRLSDFTFTFHFFMH